MNHPGTRITALVDGQLDAAEAEDVLAHVAVCDPCSAQLAAARSARRVLQDARDVPMTPELTARLLALGTPAGPDRDADRGGRPSTGSWNRSSAPAGAPGAGSAPLPGGDRRRRMPSGALHGELASRRPARLAAGATTAVGVLAAALFSLGQLPEVSPAAHPAQALTVLGRAGEPVAGAVPRLSPGTRPRVAAGVGVRPRVTARPAGATQPAVVSTALLTAGPTPGTAPAGHAAARATLAQTPPGAPDLSAPDGQAAALAWVSDNGWEPPPGLPTGYRITALRAVPGDTSAVEIDLGGPSGTIVITLQRGRLGDVVLDRSAALPVGDHRVHVLSTAPWHAVWQCGDTVVSVMAEMPSAALAELLEAYPAAPAEDGALARIARGARVVAGPWTS